MWSATLLRLCRAFGLTILLGLSTAACAPSGGESTALDAGADADAHADAGEDRASHVEDPDCIGLDCSEVQDGHRFVPTVSVAESALLVVLRDNENHEYRWLASTSVDVEPVLGSLVVFDSVGELLRIRLIPAEGTSGGRVFVLGALEDTCAAGGSICDVQATFEISFDDGGEPQIAWRSSE